MDVIRFVATVGEDQVIRPPSGVSLPGGEVEVVIQSVSAKPSIVDQDEMAATRDWFLAIAAAAEALNPPLPADRVLNHDHCAHGKPLP